MIIGLLKIDLHIHDSSSLKEKRMVTKSLKDKLRRQFNIAITETDNRDKWQVVNLGIATISTDTRYANQVLSGVVKFIEDLKEVEIIKYEIEMI